MAAFIGLALPAAGPPHSFGEPRPSPREPAARIRFERLAASTLPHFVHFNGHPRASLLPEDNGSGCAWGDYDNDGDDDLYLCNMNGPYLMAADERRRFPGSRLWRNDGGGKFTDVTPAVGLSRPRTAMGAVFADFDNDGDADLLLTSLSGVRLFRNDGSRYDDVTRQMGLGDIGGYCLGAAWGDYDRDGRLDLYLCRYVDFPADRARNRRHVAGRPAPMTTPGDYPAVANVLLHQEPTGSFRDVTQVSGTSDPTGRSMQAVWCDFDNDGWIDLFVANDQSLDRLFRNGHNGTFEDVSLVAGLFDPRGGMGIAVTDYQSDGDQDVLVTHWVAEDPAFYVNESFEGICGFEDQAMRTGLRKQDGALVGWGTSFVDFDNDGDRDLFIVHGSTIEDELTLDVLEDPRLLPQRSVVFGYDRGQWHPLGASAGAYFATAHVGRGAAVSDFDLDGRPDIAINNHGEPPALLRNVSPAAGNWLAVRLVGRHCNRDAANARVTIRCDGAPPQMQELLLGASYLSGHTKTLHFGVGTAERIPRVDVRWPCGRMQSIEAVSVNQTLLVTEPIGGKP